MRVLHHFKKAAGRPFPFHWILYALSILGSGCGFMTQILVSGFWSTAFSDDVFHFSINLACYLLSLGIGSYLSARIARPTLKHLFVIQMLLSFWTGISISILRFGIGRWGEKGAIPIFVVCVAGLLCGQLIPLTLRIGEKDRRINLPTLFFFDYCAAIAFSLVFTFLLLIPLGYAGTSLLLCFLSLVVAGLLLLYSQTDPMPSVIIGVLAFLIPFPVHHIASSVTGAPKVATSKNASIVYNRQSHYQKIVLTEESGFNPYFPELPEYVLYLDGFVQFGSQEEQNYHMCLVNIPAAAVEYSGGTVRRALILGGGDGLAARNLLGFPKLEKVTLVELDSDVIQLAKTEIRVRASNLDSLRNPKVQVVVADAFQWVKHAVDAYDIILIDFPDAKNITLSRLFTAEFYHYVFRLLKPNGVVAIQSGPSSFNVAEPVFSRAAASVRRSIASLGYSAHLYATPRESQTFVLATRNADFNMVDFSKKVGILGRKGITHFCTYATEWKEPEVALNTLNTLPVSGYMLEWLRSARRPFFYYHGNSKVFLPD